MTWTTLASLPVGRTMLAGAADGSGRIYAIGGHVEFNGPTEQVDRFDPATGVWTQVAMLPVPRERHAAAADGSGRIYAIGGRLASGSRTDRVERFDPATGVWTTLAVLPERRDDLAAATDGSGRIYAMGGISGLDLEPTTRVDRFDPATGVWTTLGAKGSLPRNLTAFAAAADASGRIYAMGGEHKNTQGAYLDSDRVERFDPATGAWTTLAPLSLARIGLAGATDGDGRIFAMGGTVRGSGVRDRVERFDPATGAWTTLAPLSLARDGLAAAADASGRVYAMGGAHGGGVPWDRVERFGPPPLGGWQVGSVAF